MRPLRHRRAAFAVFVVLTGCASSAPPPAVPEEDTSAPTASLRVRRPVATTYDPPVLTPDAVVAGVVGPAHVSCVLLEDGLLYNCALLPPIPTMDRAIKLALNGWVFRPATEAGKPVPVELRLAVPLVARGADALALPSSMLDSPRTTDRFQSTSPPSNGFREEEIGWQVERARAASARDDANVLAFKCMITVEGALKNCRPLKPHPMSDAALAAVMATWKYKPVLFEGKPIEVDSFVIRVRLKPPADGGAPDAAAVSSPDGGE